MPITEEAILAALSRIIEPDLKKDIVELDLVRDVTVDENTVHVHVEVSNPAMHSRKRMEEAVVFNLQHHLAVIRRHLYSHFAAIATELDGVVQ